MGSAAELDRLLASERVPVERFGAAYSELRFAAEAELRGLDPLLLACAKEPSMLREAWLHGLRSRASGKAPVGINFKAVIRTLDWAPRGGLKTGAADLREQKWIPNQTKPAHPWANPGPGIALVLF